MFIISMKGQLVCLCTPTEGLSDHIPAEMARADDIAIRYLVLCNYW